MSTYNHETLAPVPDLSPAPRAGGVRTVTEESDLEAVRRDVAAGLLSGSEELVNRSLTPASRGEGRERHRF